MPRYIDADKALSFPLANGEYDHKNANKHFIYGCETYREWLEQLPTVSPDEVRGVGKWIIRKTAFGKEYTVCSACLTEIKIRKTSGEIVHADTRNARYCMACGAKMEVSEDA